MSECDIDNLYIIRIPEEDELLRTNNLVQLEQLLHNDERARLEHIIEPIAIAIAFLYDPELINELEEKGYELLPQQRTKMIES